MSADERYSAWEVAELRNTMPIDLKLFRESGLMVVDRLKELRLSSLHDRPETAAEALEVLQHPIRAVPDPSLKNGLRADGEFIKLVCATESYLNRERASIGNFELCGVRDRSAHWVTLKLIGHTVTDLREAGCERSSGYALGVESSWLLENWPTAKQAILGVLCDSLKGLEDELSLELDLLWKSRISGTSDLVVIQANERNTPDRGKTANQGHDGEPIEPEADTPALRKGYLGLLIDENERIVRRAGFEGEANFSQAPLKWELFALLARNQSTYTPHGEFEGIWPTHGQTDLPGRTTVGDAVTDLRSELSKIGIDIEVLRRIGRRLIDGRQNPA